MDNISLNCNQNKTKLGYFQNENLDESKQKESFQCHGCSEIPINYVSLPCAHHFCINCLMQIYMNPFLCKKDCDDIAELVC